jgi:hypothetical protein
MSSLHEAVVCGAAISPILLIWDLGRPARFLNTSSWRHTPVSARLAGWVPAAGVCFPLGAVCSRYGWLFAARSR